MFRFGHRELIGRVAVQLEHADLFGLTVYSRIEHNLSGVEVIKSKTWFTLCCKHAALKGTDSIRFYPCLAI